MSEFKWWEYTHEQRKRFQRRGQETRARNADLVAQRYGPKIHALRIAGLSWRAVGERLAFSVNTVRRRYDRWLSNNPDLIKINVADTKRHVAWNLCRDYKQADVALMMNVSVSTIKTWVRKWSEEQDRQYLSSAPGWPTNAYNPDIKGRTSSEPERPSEGP